MTKDRFPAPLITPRLLLRRLEDGDAEALCSYRSLPEVARYQGWDSFDMADAVGLIEGQADRQPGIPGTWLQLAIVDRKSHRIAGDCGLHFLIDDPRLMEVGITLAPGFQHRGCATEALQCVLAYAFGTLGIHRICALTDEENTAAAALFLRLGFRREAHFVEHRWFKGRWESEYVFALLKREWEARTG